MLSASSTAEEDGAMATDLTVILEDRPGTLAEMAEALAGAGINIEGGGGFPIEGRGVMHILVEDAAAARRALEGTGAKVEGEREVVVTSVDDRPGALAEVARRAADARVNIDLCYLTTSAQLVLGGPDIAALRSAISTAAAGRA
jgi:hypothetical protein